MGPTLTICTKHSPSPSSQSYSSPTEELLLSQFNEISSDPLFTELESRLGPFQFIHNYFIEGHPHSFTRVPLNYEDSEVSKTHIVLSPLIGKDSEGPWVYIGECLVSTSVKDGRGFLVHLTQHYKFQGYFREDMRNGRGRLVTKEKLQEGDWIGDELAGEGKEVGKDGSVYQGKFANGLYDGLGKMVFGDKSQYSGEFSRGERSGYGEYSWNDGSKYVGNWLMGKFSGIGKYLDVHGSIYEGGWKENQMDGYGEFVWRDGKKYRGNYYNGKKHGYGEMYWPDGRSWTGNWKCGKMHGKGEFFNNTIKKSGVWYEGKFVQWKDSL